MAHTSTMAHKIGAVHYVLHGVANALLIKEVISLMTITISEIKFN